jgi:hypothetical protein
LQATNKSTSAASFFMPKQYRKATSSADATT